MNLPEYSLRNGRVIGFFLLVLLVGGAVGFTTLGKKEDSTFVIKSATLLCSYPGATPEEVESLIAEPIEREVQSMRRVHKITSESWYGRSKIQVELDPATPASQIPQLWDELRRKTLNVTPRLPEGASPITVADDFGDVYGIYYGLSADEGFAWSELRDWAERLKVSLVTVEGVQKVTLYGEQTPVVDVYVSLSTLANFSIRPETIVATIRQQNTIVNSGEKRAGELRVRLLEDGTYRTLDDLSDQLLISSSGKQYRLGDIAHIERGYSEPPQALMRVDGRRAVGIGISTEEGVDVVKTGAKIDAVLSALTSQMPVGLELTVLYPEDRIARDANRTFVLNLAESVAIVVLIIMLVMGFRSGLVIGSSLLFSIGGTLLLMQLLGEGLNRTSLAGFIIAMGMLVDNAIVVTDNARQAMLRGAERRRALIDGANAPRWSLLGAKLPQPLTSEESRRANFTNEGGVGYIRYLKNIMGLWIVQCIQKQLGISFGEMVDLARTSGCDRVFDVNDPRFTAPADMKAEIAAALSETGPAPAGDADLIRSVYRSLAESYGKAVREMEAVTGRSWDILYIAGGGAKNALLNDLTARATGKRVIALPIEATAIGNLKVQMKIEEE